MNDVVWRATGNRPALRVVSPPNKNDLIVDWSLPPPLPWAMCLAGVGRGEEEADLPPLRHHLAVALGTGAARSLIYPKIDKTATNLFCKRKTGLTLLCTANHARITECFVLYLKELSTDLSLIVPSLILYSPW